MLAIISPAKNLNFKPQNVTKEYSQADFLKDANVLIKKLRKLKQEDISKLMEVNPKIAQLNYERYIQWGLPFTPENSKQAVLLFNGEVYNGLKAETLSEKDLLYAQEHLRILSGLYGVLRPLDLMQPYRLEMGRPLETKKAKNLYEFWGLKITKAINMELEKQKEKVLLNLASNEYFKSIKKDKIKARIITPVFKELKGDRYKVIVVYAKKARGLMARYMIKNRIEEAEQLKHFDEEGYFYNEQLSSENEWVFTR